MNYIQSPGNNAHQIGTETPMPPGLQDRLNSIGQPLGETIDLLREIEGRLFGQRPQEVRKDEMPQLTHLSGTLELMLRGAHETLDLAQRILRQL